ncbi:MAG: arsenosugar biosynthesis radical SAM protein ArsS [Myxococcota bacterium]|nr:arsenosugar biosynthesis radical SAM protein ArsS [Myxococcota bacterium]
MNDFDAVIQHTGRQTLQAQSIDTFQVNIGFLCNQKCIHCHLAASPTKTEMMDCKTMETVLETAKMTPCRTLDITGGAPELHPNLRGFIASAASSGIGVQVRTNLAVLMEAGNEDLPNFYKDYGVSLVGSMPCYLEENVTAQRGPGVYRKSVAAIRRLNALGYGVDSDPVLNLVYNPGGAFLPPDQTALESDYKQNLKTNWGISFTNLMTVTNMPIGRFKSYLESQGEETAYMQLLRNAFNPLTLDALMCRSQISVGWDGRLYDCDFNLALGIGIQNKITHIDDLRLNLDLDLDKTLGRTIATGNHCFGCTAGNGSSCRGALV